MATSLKRLLVLFLAVSAVDAFHGRLVRSSVTTVNWGSGVDGARVTRRGRMKTTAVLDIGNRLMGAIKVFSGAKRITESSVEGVLKDVKRALLDSVSRFNFLCHLHTAPSFLFPFYCFTFGDLLLILVIKSLK
jgi:hypothetical protein